VHLLKPIKTASAPLRHPEVLLPVESDRNREPFLSPVRRAGQSARTASQPDRPSQASLGTTTTSCRPECRPRCRAPAAMTAAHRTLPFGTRVAVLNNHTGRSVVVRINDRGPFVGGRVPSREDGPQGANCILSAPQSMKWTFDLSICRIISSVHLQVSLQPRHTRRG
jgi:Lytic transglycolase